MGLTQVYSTFYKHNAKINVKSRQNEGTTFEVTLPIIREKSNKRVIVLENLVYSKEMDFKTFLNENKRRFEELMLENTKTVIDQLEGTKFTEETFLQIARNIMSCLQDDLEHRLITYAQENGKEWAELEIAPMLLVEWFKGFRDVYWTFLYNYHRHVKMDIDSFFNLERQTNFQLDLYLTHYFSSYDEKRDEVIRTHREVIDELSVPIIPLSGDAAILPIIGTFDTYRAQRLQERSFEQIEKIKIKRMILDLSGVAFIDTAVTQRLFKIIDGYKLLGCSTIITGIRHEVANALIDMGIELEGKFEIKGDLKQALDEFKLL